MISLFLLPFYLFLNPITPKMTANNQTGTINQPMYGIKPTTKPMIPKTNATAALTFDSL